MNGPASGVYERGPMHKTQRTSATQPHLTRPAVAKRRHEMQPKITRLRTTLIGVLAAVVASLGVSATAANALATHHSRHHTTHHTHHKSTHKKSSGIPQNGGGDNDADNHGGPSDGDGNL